MSTHTLNLTLKRKFLEVSQIHSAFIYVSNSSLFIYRSSGSEVSCRKGVLRNFAKYTGKHLCQSLFFNEVAGIRPVTLSKKRPWHSYFLVNFAKFLRTPFFTEKFRWLLLYMIDYYQSFASQASGKCFFDVCVFYFTGFRQVFLRCLCLLLQ